MSAVQPGCYFRCGRKAAIGRLFCSAKCAAEWAEEMARGNADQWCVVCQDWKPVGVHALACDHTIAGLTEGAKHKDAAYMYNEASK